MSLLAMLNPTNIIGKGIEMIGNYQMKKKDIKMVATQAQAKLEMAKLAGKTEIALKDSEWEAIAQAKSDSTWKDEYVTLIITAPIVGVLGGSIWNAFTGNSRLLDGTLAGIDGLINLGMDYGVVMTMVVAAAVSVKAVGTLRK